MKVAGVILAAGASSRLGEAKQLVRLDGERLLERAVRIAFEAGLEPVVVVLGCCADQIRTKCRLEGAMLVRNEAWAEGMGSSVRAGIGALPVEVDGIILMTCDQPAVTALHLRFLVQAATGTSSVGSIYEGKIGVPAFFPAARFWELQKLRGDAGARKLLGPENAVELPGGELDIDTAETLAAARRQFESALRSDR